MGGVTPVTLLAYPETRKFKKHLRNPLNGRKTFYNNNNNNNNNNKS